MQLNTNNVNEITLFQAKAMINLPNIYRIAYSLNNNIQSNVYLAM